MLRELSFWAAGHDLSEMGESRSSLGQCRTAREHACTASTPESLAVYHIRQPLVVFCFRINGNAMRASTRTAVQNIWGCGLGAGRILASGSWQLLGVSSSARAVFVVVKLAWLDLSVDLSHG